MPLEPVTTFDGRIIRKNCSSEIRSVLIWNFAFTFHGLNNFRLLTRGGGPWSITPLLVIIQLHTLFHARLFFFPNDSIYTFFSRGFLEAEGRMDTGKGREGKKFKSREKKTVWETLRSSSKSPLLGMDVVVLPSSPFSRLGLNTFRIFKLVETEYVRRGEITVNH